MFFPVGENAEQRLADELAQRIEDSGEPEVIRLRELRDAHLKQERLTLNRRSELQRVFEKRGLSCSLPLTDADLDEDIEVSLARVSLVDRLRRGVARPLIGGVRGVALVIGLIAAVVALYPLVQAPADPKPMSGDVNLVVAGFVDEQSESGGEGLGETLFRSLRATTRPSDDPGDPDIQVRGPAAVDLIARAGEAVQVAKENGAQIVVYGQISHRAQGAFAVPRFYVDPRLLTGAEELGGDFSLPAIDMGDEGTGGSIAGRARLRTVVSEDFHAFAAFATGLGWFSAARWEHALAWFKRSEDKWQAGDGAALSSLFIGNTAGKLGKFQAAEAAYRHALELAPEIARAELGLTEIELHRASSDCSGISDGRALEAAATEFSRLYDDAKGSGLPLRAFLLRARLGEARANLCLGFGGPSASAEAAAIGFQEVIQRGTGNASFVAEVAEARAGLGLAALQAASKEDQQAYFDAKEEYKQALQLTNDPTRAQEFARVIELIDARLGESVWSRTDPLPAGVQAEIEYFGIGDPICGPVIPPSPKIFLDQRPFYQFEIVKGANNPELGETFSICPRGLITTQPVALTVQGPDGFIRHASLPPVDDDRERSVTYWLSREWPPGTYVAIASQGSETVRSEFRVSLPVHRGVRTPVDFGDPITPNAWPIMVIGQPPNSSVIVDVYRDPQDPRNSVEPHYRYATSFELETDENGIAEKEFPPREDDEGTFLLRVRGLGSYDNQDLISGFSICAGEEC